MNGNAGQRILQPSDKTAEPIAAPRAPSAVVFFQKIASMKIATDARREEAGKFLDVLKRLVEVAEQRARNNRRHDHRRQTHRATYRDQVALGFITAGHVPVYVHREDG